MAAYLTHVIFAFVHLNPDGSLTVGPVDPAGANPQVDTLKTYQRLQEILAARRESNGRLKAMFGVGGWTNSQNFPLVISKPELTRNFIRSVIQILDYFNLDGIDIDFDYPVTGADRQNYVNFLRTLQQSLKEHALNTQRKYFYLLSISGAAGTGVLDSGYDLPKIAQLVSFINVMTYDYFGPWGTQTGPVAPLFSSSDASDNQRQANINATMSYYACRVKDLTKLTLGIPFYGRYWNHSGTATNAKNPLWRTGAQAVGGFEPWATIKKSYLTNPTFEQHFDKPTETPYLITTFDPKANNNNNNAQNKNGPFLLSYENPRSVQEKVKYAAAKGLGGVSMWAVDYDDPDLTLLRTVSSNVLCGNGGGVIPRGFKCSP